MTPFVGDLIKRRTKFQRPVERDTAAVHVLGKYMQAFISQEGPWNLTAGVSLAERAALSFEYNIPLPSRQTLDYRIAETLAIVLDFVLGRTPKYSYSNADES